MHPIKDKKASVGGVIGITVGIVFILLSVILVMAIAGDDTVVDEINDGMDGIFTTGWGLSGLFDSSDGGLIGLVYVAAIFITTIVLIFGLVRFAGRKK